MKNLVFLVGSWMFFHGAVAQLSTMKIGDKIPNVYLGKLLHSSGSRLKINDLKGKLVILDFWNVHCKTCIADMPKLDSLQKKFGQKIQILAVTANTKQEVNLLFSKIKICKPDFPFIVNDTVFNLLFPHEGDPMHVWISPKGIVTAITFDYETNDQTIGLYLNNKNPTLTRRWDFGINTQYPLVSEQNSSLMERAKYYSVLFKGLHEYSSDNFIAIKDTFIRLINCTMLQLFGVAYNNDLYHSTINQFQLRRNNRIILEVADTSRFYYSRDEKQIADWINKNQFSYELKVSPEQNSLMFKFMQQDLLRYLPYIATIEKRKTCCWVLISVNPEKLPVCTNIFSKAVLRNENNYLVISNMPISALINEIIYANVSLVLPIMEDINLAGNIDLSIKSKLTDFNAMNLELKKYGLKFIQKNMEIDMLIVKNQ